MDFTKRWTTEHGYQEDPHRRATIAEIVRWLDEGFLLWYVVCWDWQVRSTSQIPIPVAIRLNCAWTPEWVLNGLFPPECDKIRSHCPDDGNGNDAVHEMCVVAVVATLLHQRGIRLDERTVHHLHGEIVLFGDRDLPPSRYAPVRLFQRVENNGWDEVVDFFVEEQKDLYYRATGRRGRGRPRTRNSTSAHPSDLPYCAMWRR